MRLSKEQTITTLDYVAIYTQTLWTKAHIGSEKLESGCVAVNTGVVALAEAPFGGIKQTGYGREGGSGAIKDYLNVKYTHMGLKI
jgi:succinate-semialdehyde dehydrogenase/glutarate-semialdehyde dehydrogenase